MVQVDYFLKYIDYYNFIFLKVSRLLQTSDKRDILNVHKVLNMSRNLALTNHITVQGFINSLK